MTEKEKPQQRRIKFRILFECDNTKLEENIYEDDWNHMSMTQKMQRLTSLVILNSQALRAIQNTVEKIRIEQQNKRNKKNNGK